MPNKKTDKTKQGQKDSRLYELEKIELTNRELEEKKKGESITQIADRVLDEDEVFDELGPSMVIGEIKMLAELHEVLKERLLDSDYDKSEIPNHLYLFNTQTGEDCLLVAPSGFTLHKMRHVKE